VRAVAWDNVYITERLIVLCRYFFLSDAIVEKTKDKPNRNCRAGLGPIRLLRIVRNVIL
jgi:hypothetical protein